MRNTPGPDPNENVIQDTIIKFEASEITRYEYVGTYFISKMPTPKNINIVQ